MSELNDQLSYIINKDADLEKIKYLVSQGADVNYILTESIEYGYFDIMKFLVEKGADIDEALSESASNGHLDFVKYLINEKHADILANNNLAIKGAASGGHLDIVKYLFSLGGSANRALKSAAANNEFEIVKFILLYTDNFVKNEALQLSIQYQYLDIAKYLSANGAVLNHNMDRENFERSLSQKHFEMIKFLVEVGADLHEDDEYLLRLSANKGYFDFLRFLVGKGADIHVDDDYPLRESASRNDLEMVKYLIQFYTQKELKELNIDYVNKINNAVLRIQQGMENWLYKPTTRDNKVGIVPRLAWQDIEKRQSGSGTIKKLCKKCNINYHKSDKQKYKELSRYFKKLSLI
jgi:ankyrin repeat protein